MTYASMLWSFFRHLELRMIEEGGSPPPPSSFVVHQTYPWQVALQHCPRQFWLDTSSICEFGGLAAYVWCTPGYYSTDPVNDLIAHRIQHGHLVLSLCDLTIVIVLQISFESDDAGGSHMHDALQPLARLFGYPCLTLDACT